MMRATQRKRSSVASDTLCAALQIDSHASMSGATKSSGYRGCLLSLGALLRGGQGVDLRLGDNKEKRKRRNV